MNLDIVGTGKIVVDALFAMQPVKDIKLKSIFARPRSREKGVALAKKFGIPEVFTDYDEMLDSDDVDTVYIGLVNMVHFEYAKKALEKGINVILEKPFVGNYPEAEELIDIAKEKGCFIFEAITVLHNDVILKMKEALPKLGRIRMMTANYSQYSSRYDRYLSGDVDPAFDPACLSGALRDINVYNIHYAAELFGRPEKVSYHPNRGFNGVDTSGTLVMEYDGFSAVCTGAKDSDSPCFVTVQGEKGYMKIDGKPNVAPNLTIVTVDDSGELVKDAAGAMTRKTIIEEFVPPETHHRMTREFIDFARIIDEKDYREWERYARETLDVMSVLDRC